ncbi:MAG TPA: hypothetical protein VF272_01490 [Candidatus Saccharimonadia bacterium]
MQEVQNILVVMLSIGFAVLLVLGIIMVFILIRIITNIRHITQRLDETTENMGEMAKHVGRKIAPAALSALGSLLVRKAKSKVKRG